MKGWQVSTRGVRISMRSVLMHHEELQRPPITLAVPLSTMGILGSDVNPSICLSPLNRT